MFALVLSSPVRVVLRAAVPVAVLALCALLLAPTLSMDVVLSMPERLGDISWGRWVLALACTMGSFWAVAQYDALAHRALGTGISPQRAQVSGAIGIALGQTLGFGVVTGAVARWRMLGDLRLGQAAKVSAFVGASFVICWAVLAALASLILPGPEWAFWPALAVCLAVPALPVVLLLCPVIRTFGVEFHLPSLPISGAILFWALIDTGLAATALFILLPAGTLDFATFFPLFLIALGSGLVSNTPGGVGPFELVLLSAVPAGDPAAIIAAILGFRVVYYALPAICAGLALMRPFGRSITPALRTPPARATGPRSEVAVVAQNGGAIAARRDSTLALWPTAQTLTLFTDPMAGSRDAALDHIQTAARAAGKLALIYKCDARMATTARTARWRVLHFADEAVVDLARFDLSVPSRRALRRKLRATEKANVTLRAGHPLPFTAMARIDAEWQASHGQARGGSMGRYCPDYVARQWVGCAYVAGRLVGFVTAHRGPDEWCLDIMRHSDDVPDGTMHALVNAAITAASRAGASRFSLAAVPACPDPHSAVWRWAAFKVAARAGGRGLRQFKSSFAPRWVPRYAAAQSWGGLTLGLADIARVIQRPGSLAPATTTEPHNVDENYELDSIKAA
ncbi:phosphatidylglycerol lysyltransferase domain-containing protein [uncultured Tateyamaria sp.]|uniref:phosphatidylglycerol lysyltransferase domain-containing protein n=1 Tax=uncultured Tateyamaria sp. TaxID=455651 RepID=UPI00260251D6|nr:phosphatidylglycerol lysyltransferase domain-containing protein [uncultured Tateyamaria sp.]